MDYLTELQKEHEKHRRLLEVIDEQAKTMQKLEEHWKQLKAQYVDLLLWANDQKDDGDITIDREDI